MESRRIVTSVVVAAFLASFVLVQDCFSQRRFRRRAVAPTQISAPLVRAPAGAGNVSSKSLLAKVPADVRQRFLESLVFKGGGLAGARIDEVKASLGTQQYVALMASCGCNGWHENWVCGTKGCQPQKDYMCNPDKCATQTLTVTLGSAGILASTPAPERKKFLESIDFVNGRLVSAYVGDVQRRLKPAEFDHVFQAMGAQPGDVKSKAKNGLYSVGSAGVAQPRGPAIRLQ